MTSTRRLVQFFLLALLTTFGCRALAADQPIEFSWAVLTDTHQGQKSLTFPQTDPLPDGATLQIFLEQKRGVFIYLFLIDSSGSLQLLFPRQIEYFKSNLPESEIIRIPEGAARFRLTSPPGQEKFYLMASANRLEKLEELTGKYLLQPEDTKLKAAVVQEMKKIRRGHSIHTQSTGTGVPIAGTVRSEKKADPTFEVTRVQADTFYSTVLRVDHE